MGSAFKITEVAKGSANLYLAPKKSTMHLWDVCAPSVILEEAGGIITDLEGNSLDFNHPESPYSRGIIATTRKLHPLLIKPIKGILSELI